MFIQTEATPNPATLKFLPGRAVLESGTLDMPTKRAASQSALAERLFDIPNVGGVFFGSDFISVTKNDGEWQQIKPAILGAIMEHYMSGAALVASDAQPAAAADDEFFDAKDADIGILVLGAGTGKEGPGPLVSDIAKTAGTFPIPVAIVPGHLSDEDLEAMA